MDVGKPAVDSGNDASTPLSIMSDTGSLRFEMEGGLAVHVPSTEGSCVFVVPANNWVSNLLYLTHDALRKDMVEMQKALQPRYMGDLPQSWRIREWFSFFQPWCTLVSQFQAVQTNVNYELLGAPAGVPGEVKAELLSFQRSFQLELLAIARLEKRILHELATTDWGNEEPVSECAELLRVRVRSMCETLEAHLGAQEKLLPELLLKHWGRVAPPHVHARMLQAAKSALSTADKGKDSPKLLGWVMHYLQQRDPKLLKEFITSAKLSLWKRLAMQSNANMKYGLVLEHLNYILLDREPKGQPTAAAVTGQPAATDARGEADVEESKSALVYAYTGVVTGPGAKSEAKADATAIERRRKAGTVNAVLAAANSQRRDVNIKTGTINERLGTCLSPTQKVQADGTWWMRAKRVPSGVLRQVEKAEREAKSAPK